MKTIPKLRHEFVEFIPEVLDEAVIYISIPFATVVHLCVCGCGEEVVTPLSPTDWLMTYDGETVSLTPSIGNWSLECRSHYLIKRDRVRWSTPMSESAIEAGRRRDRIAKQRQYGEMSRVEPLVGEMESSMNVRRRWYVGSSGRNF